MGQSAGLQMPPPQMPGPPQNGRAAPSGQPAGVPQQHAAPPPTSAAPTNAPPSAGVAAAAQTAGGAGGSQSTSMFGRLKSAVQGRRIDDVCDVDQRKCLGSGSFAKVYKGRLKENGQAVAVKVMKKEALRRMQVPASAVKSEVDLMQECAGQDRFVMVHDFIEGTTRYYIVLEFCAGGCLQDAAVKEEEQHSLRELQVRVLMTQMLEAVGYLHAKRICHRDVKPHNFLVTGRVVEPRVLVKLADFGIAVRFDKNPNKLMKEQVGTPAFMAPEIHLLPRRSPGYDHKVDIWAIGVCMVFLLAAEYPFVDGRGALLRDQLVRGELPLWEEASFQGLFQGFQEKLGMRRKRPSKLARDLIRRLISPRRETRLEAKSALKHEWFVKPIQEDDGAADDVPLLRAEDFDEGFKFLEQSAAWAAEVAGKAADQAMHNIGSVAVSGFEGPINVDMNDERVTTCVVCYETSGVAGYMCPKCNYTVCVVCLQKLKKPMCPHCRHEPGDMAFAQAVAQAVASASTRVSRIQDIAVKAAAMNVGSVDIAASADLPLTEEQIQRRKKCFACQEPSTEWSYACPACHTNHCYKCTKEKLSVSMRCPSCKETQMNKEALQQYLYIADAINGARELGSGLYTRMASGVTDPMSQLTTAAEGVANALPSFNNQALGIDKAVAAAPLSNVAVGDGLTRHVPSRARLESCGICGTASSWADHVCPRCSTSVCSACICSRLKEDPRCPHCGDRALNEKAMKWTQNVQEARDLVGDLWRIGSEMFGVQSSEPAPLQKPASAPVYSTLPVSPEDTHQHTQALPARGVQPSSPQKPPQPGSPLRPQDIARMAKRPPCRLGSSCTNRLASHAKALAHPGDADYEVWKPENEPRLSVLDLVDDHVGKLENESRLSVLDLVDNHVAANFSDVEENPDASVKPTCREGPGLRAFSDGWSPLEQRGGASRGMAATASARTPSRSRPVLPGTTRI